MDLIFFIIAFVLIFVLGISTGWRARELYAQRLLNHILEQHETKETKKEENVVHIMIEKHHETFYAFERKTDKFLGQAPTRDELDTILTEKFPGKRFGVTPENMTEIGWV